MRLGRVLIFLVLILVIGVGVVFVFYQRFVTPSASANQVFSPTPTPMLTADVVVVTQHVRRGEMVGEDVLSMVPYPKDLVMQGMIANVADVVGKRAKMDLESGIPLTQNMITTSTSDISGQGSDAALMIPRGMVAVSIPISRLNSVSYAPARGDHVNVLVSLLMIDLDTDFQTKLPNLTSGVIAPGGTLLAGAAAQGTQVLTTQNTEGAAPLGRAYEDPAFESPFYLLPSESQRPRLVSQTLIQDVIVLQMGDFETEQQTTTAKNPQSSADVNVNTNADPVSEENPQATTTPTAPPPPPDVITLIVTPQDAVTLNYLMFSGAELSLALRSANDDTRVQTEAVTLQFLLDQYKVPIPVKLPFGLEPRIDEVVAPTLVPQVAATPQP